LELSILLYKVFAVNGGVRIGIFIYLHALVPL